MKKIFAMLIALLLLTLVISACTKKVDDTKTIQGSNKMQNTSNQNSATLDNEFQDLDSDLNDSDDFENLDDDLDGAQTL